MDDIIYIESAFCFILAAISLYLAIKNDKLQRDNDELKLFKCYFGGCSKRRGR
jgi:hypothetical protein